ncbi:hypothetical protein A3C18_01260 [Candidatus Kaiserbacteria bacterium RIFCSPHIGHO2_02_FULL_54_11b]|uniref:Uncharacterized protein n=2 Tax=Candidatus Kaiseribacteriota TaxID=1752734 RepID=A0A1F6CR14_9BACT|nr:MAG: hypothetical protein A2704_06685 [Candidatus Kaiserbacteria bacterium RIFCSPHIGHO2_01_FULL_54_36b]OGG64588.1 MAG: hypothetical protein A3C18_01260 [Candidatus Kaiserbacteria bacterium RIFCSPHIGHO2_02_FULL_54_11b]
MMKVSQKALDEAVRMAATALARNGQTSNGDVFDPAHQGQNNIAIATLASAIFLKHSADEL